MKDFLLLSNINAITYKEFFPLLKNDKARAGYVFNKTLEFETPEGEKSGPNIAWFTTLPTPGKKKLVLTKRYHKEDYPHYDNYNAIEVGKVKDIPGDYDDVMGVPITIFGYDLDNVEVLQLHNSHGKDPEWNMLHINGKDKYARILIKKNYSPEQFEIIGLGITESGISCGVKTDYTDEEIEKYKKDSDAWRIGTLFFIENGKAKVPYARILVRRKK